MSVRQYDIGIDEIYECDGYLFLPYWSIHSRLNNVLANLAVHNISKLTL